MKLVVNGKILLGNISGIERFSWEILKVWDQICSAYRDLSIDILVPEDAKADLSGFLHLHVARYGKSENLTLWQQICVPEYIKKTHGIYVGLANNAPLRICSGFVVLHDISPLKNKSFYSKKDRLKFKIETKHIIRSNIKMITDSHFSASEIADEFHIPEKEIYVIGNGWEHMKNVGEDPSVLRRNHLKSQGFYFSLSSLAPNKNLKWIMETARLNPDCLFVIGGGYKKEIFGSVRYDIPQNVMMLGRVTDEEAKTLFKNCIAFLFPTLYEGFGIPPLEAYACGAVSIVSDTRVMHEIYGDSAAYVDTSTPCSDLRKIVLPVYSEHADLLVRHSWNKYAINLLNYICQRESEGGSSR